MNRQQHALLVENYQRYLVDGESGSFVRATTQRYTVGTLERLALYGPRDARRAAALSLGLIADYQSNATLGKCLSDSDRGVRLLAENGIRDLWVRDGTVGHRRILINLVRLNCAGQFESVIRKATKLIEEVPWFAESWNQRAIAYFQACEFRDSANDCQQTLELNPYHYGAAVGMGQCYLELNDGWAALECFRRALRLNPGLEAVRLQVDHLQRALEEPKD
jgi:tetratricopeptide (TPR) repeat protein